ncbi:MAG: hypothetical protein CVV06_17545, partial [Gammaproteobacteria bacterium HGW-Gammaproteobacteria-10]
LEFSAGQVPQGAPIAAARLPAGACLVDSTALFRMMGLQHFHRSGEASNYRSPFDRALLSLGEGLRANGSLRLSTALFRLIVMMKTRFPHRFSQSLGAIPRSRFRGGEVR